MVSCPLLTSTHMGANTTSGTPVEDNQTNKTKQNKTAIVTPQPTV
jgi:hypothetical protein